MLPPTPIMIAKLRSLSEHYCDFAALLLVVRAVREQLDWTEIREATQDNPFAEAFLLLIERLGILGPFDAPSTLVTSPDFRPMRVLDQLTACSPKADIGR